MIKPEQIPDEVVEAAAKALCKEQRMFWPDLNNDEHNIIRGEARAAIAAALAAWPGAHERPYWDLMTNARHVEIILPQEARDD
jgi:hypothetical protein